MIVYISGPYSAKTYKERQANIEAARKVAYEYWRKGFTVICPHANTANFDDCYGKHIGHEGWLKGDLEILLRCDAIVMMYGWEESKGACMEHAYAQLIGIPIFYAVEQKQPEISLVEKNYNRQTEAFLQELMNIYRLYKTKNQDYGPFNILVTGEIGVLTRTWDKMARLLNLFGFRFTVDKTAKLEPPRDPKHESVDDSITDLINYGLIWKLLRRNAWGK